VVRKAILLVALAAATVSPGGAATGETCLSCRAIGSFRTCQDPGPENKPFFKARVVGVERTTCSERLVVDVPREVADLPSRIRVDLGQCLRWAGELNDVIDLAVQEPLATDGGVYRLGCGYRWGG
jgi:hypothetical protein